MLKNIVLSLAVMVFMACGSSKNESSDQSALSYDLSENGCDTGEHSFGSLNEYCKGLKDDALNKGCAYYLRSQTYQESCSSQGPFSSN